MKALTHSPNFYSKHVFFDIPTGTWEQKFPKENTHYRNFRVNEKTSIRVPMMTNKGNYLAAADHELECDILQVGSVTFGLLTLDLTDTDGP